MCDETEKKSQQTAAVPDYVTTGSKQAIGQASSVASKPYQAYKGQRVADFTADQQSAFQKIRDLFTGGGIDVTGATDYAKAPAQQIGTERIVDEGGKLGAINDYINPYREQAIQPAIQAILDQQAEARKNVGAMATMGGAFGDARHGILEQGVNEATSEALGSTVGSMMSEGFDKAMAARTSDLDRFTNVDKTNADYMEMQLKRMLEGTQAAGDDQLKHIQALLASGSLQQGQAQQKNDAMYEEFLRKYGHDFSTAELLAKVLGSVPYTRTATTTETTPDNSIAGILGSLGGSFLGTEKGAGTAAALLSAI
jgi:hypothetical protein